MEQIAVWSATALAAKMLADELRRRYGFAMPGRLTSARGPIDTDLAYVIAAIIALPVVLQIGLDAALLVVIVLRTGAIVGERVVLPGNHAYLELYLALVCLRLHETPVALASVLQVMTVSVWLYAVFQKLFQGEYLDGTFFYLMTPYNGWSLGKWASYIRKVPAIDGDYVTIDPDVQRFCQRLAMLVLITEAVPPILAFAASGTIWSVLLLLVVALPVGLFTRETNFMATNLLLAASFLVPFDTAALLGSFGDPIVAGVLGWCLVWPPIHANLTGRLRFSPWRLGAWGMYSRHVPRVDIVLSNGELRRLRDSAIPARMLRDFGACRIGWMRDAIRRYFFHWACAAPATAVAFRWYLRRGDRFVTHCVIYRNVAGAPVETFEICDEFTAAAFARHLSSLADTPLPPAHTPVTPSPGVDAKEATA
jgi:hypothetical protein